MQSTQFGPLSAVLTPHLLSPQETQMTVVLLHGYGAPGTDLVPLAPALLPLPGVRFVFLAAPHPLAEFGALEGGRAWWPIDMIRLHVARMTGQNDALAQETPAGLVEAREALSQALAALRERYGVEPERLVLGGFSQGAMLACDWALRSSEPLLGLIQLSGTIICEPDWRRLLAGRKGLPVFQSHSPDDEVLPLSMAEKLASLMIAAGLQHEFVQFRGGHGIPPAVLARLRDFLKARLTSREG